MLRIFLRSCVLAGVGLALGCGGSAESGPKALTPRGGECPVGPPSPCQIDAQRTDRARFEGLKALAEAIDQSSHPLHDATLADGEKDVSVGGHILSVAIVMSTWPTSSSEGPSNTEGNAESVQERVRCAADRLIALGSTADPAELVCWAEELYRTGRVYTRLVRH